MERKEYEEYKKAKLLKKLRDGATIITMYRDASEYFLHKELATALMTNTTVTKMDLTQNCIDDKGAKDLAAVLENNTTLTEICLLSNGISAAGAKDLALCELTVYLRNVDSGQTT